MQTNVTTLAAVRPPVQAGDGPLLDSAGRRITDPKRLYLYSLVQARRGTTFRSLSKDIGRNEAYIYQYIFVGTPKDLCRDDWMKVAQVLGVDWRILMNPPKVEGLVSLEDKDIGVVPPGAELSYGLDHVPCYIGRSAMGQLVQDTRSYPVPRPATLFGVPDAYALVFEGEHLSPIVRPGATLYAHPFLPAMTGDLVSVRLRGGGHAVGVLEQRDDKGCVLAYTYPRPNAMRLLSKSIEAVHKIVQIALV